MADAACSCGLHNDRETACTCDGRYRSAAWESDWEPTGKTLSWSPCLRVVDGRFCEKPSEGWASIPANGMSGIVRVPRCEEHGNV